MSVEDDLKIIAEQERHLVFGRFDGDTAWRIASGVRARVAALSACATIDIQVGGVTLLRHAMPGVAPVTGDWVRRKGNVALRFHRSSYAIGLMLEQEGATLESKYGLSGLDFAAHGGAVPVRAEGVGVVGVAVVSGLPQRLDHAIMTAAMAEVLGLPIPELAAS